MQTQKQRRHYNKPALYAAEDFRLAAAVLALAVALYLFCAALYATEDFRPGLAAVFFECHIFCAALNEGVLRLSESRFARFSLARLPGRAWAISRCVPGGVTWSVDAAAVEGECPGASLMGWPL